MLAPLTKKVDVNNVLHCGWMTMPKPLVIDSGAAESVLPEGACPDCPVQHASNSSPGPDGIPFFAWRALGGFATRALYEAFLAIASPAGTALMKSDFAKLKV